MSPLARAGRGALLGLGLACVLASAQAPSDFARQWPIEADGGEGLLRLELDAEVYASMSHSDLGDLVAFDGDGRALALELLAPPAPSPQRPAAVHIELPLFRLPIAAAGEGPERIALLIARDASGRLSRLQADIGPDAPAGAGEILLLDASALEDPLQALLVDLAPEAASLDARVEVQASHDLASWTDLGAAQALVRLEQNGLRLERTRLALGGTRAHYLRLRRVDADAPLPILRLRAELRPDAEAVGSSLQRVGLSGSPDPERPGRFVYRLPGPLPVERLLLAPGNGSGAFTARVASRGADDRPLQARAELVVFQLGQGKDAVRPDPVPVARSRDFEWIVDTQPAQSSAPRVEVEYSPEQVLVLAQGPKPWRLAAGSARTRREAVPLQPVLAQLRTRHGAGWQPPLAGLGPGSVLAGAVALEPAAPPIAWRQVLLWLVLGGGGLLVIGLVLHLLRQPRAPE